MKITTVNRFKLFKFHEVELKLSGTIGGLMIKVVFVRVQKSGLGQLMGRPRGFEGSLL